MTQLLSVDQAIERILENFEHLPGESISIEEALGRFSATDVIASLDLPPFPNSAVDGYALRSEDTQNITQGVQTRLKVVEDIRAGCVPTTELKAGEAARVMTGGMIPQGADAVIPVEDTISSWRGSIDEQPAPTEVQILRSVKPGEGIRPIGESVRKGQRVIQRGKRLRPADIAILASLGQSTVEVTQKPRVVILSSGDELLNPGEALQPGKIYDSNSYALAALVQEAGGVPIRSSIIADQINAVRSAFAAIISHSPDLILSSAGVSVGTVDLIRQVLEEMGEISFWRINLRPGKPLAFGKLGEIPFFGLPGNPVSAMVTFEILVKPALAKMAGSNERPRQIQAIVGERIESDGRRSYIRVRLEDNGQTTVAYSTGTQSSGALSSMVEADGLLIIPEGIRTVEKGTILTVQLL